jgi:patatin-like phospholipase/acyl hydrolase
MAYTIVSFCGGGVRGLMSATILQMLAKQEGSILTNTNLFAGTSTGAGIISGLVGGQSVETIIQNFYLEAAEFYSKPNNSPNTPAYENTEFVRTQNNLHGTNTLASLNPQQVLFTAFNVGAAGINGGQPTPWSPQLYTNIPNPLFPTAGTSIVDAVVASSSMPGMLPSYNGNVDGAFVNHDPTLAAIALAVSSGIDINNIAAICIGTGFMGNWIGSDTTQWGANQWLNGDGTGNYDVPTLLINENFLSGNNPCPILNISMNGTSSNLTPNLSQLLLPGRYVNLNPVFDRYIPENAHTAEDLEYLVSQANSIPTQMEIAHSLLENYW